MKRILVVEDEKMIRQGIVTMIKRIPIEVEEVLECKNGEEALAILKECQIDLMLTDIRMPKMDGIELVKRVQLLPHKPQVVVISGYDDFNYAVEVLRQGVRDYLLKPIEREKLAELLLNIEEDMQDSKQKEDVIKQIGNQQFKYLILNEKINEDEIEATEMQFKELFPSGRYVVICMNPSEDSYGESEEYILLSAIEGHTVLLLEEHKLDSFLAKQKEQSLMKEGSVEQISSVGISSVHEGLRQLREGFLEAVNARKNAFVKNVPFYYFAVDNTEYERVPDDFAEQFAQLFGTAKMEEGLSRLNNICFKAQMNKISAETILNVTEDILSRLSSVYERIIEIDIQEFSRLREPLQYKNAKEYYQVLGEWMKKMQRTIREEFDDCRNKEKIAMAMQYIQENYASDLNMAVVSNHISMNYSLFSLNFKEYAGTNFVNYLKKIRIEEAKRLLKETDDKIIDISMEVGYENEKHFMKTFKSICGVSPTEYRRNAQMGRN